MMSVLPIPRVESMSSTRWMEMEWIGSFKMVPAPPDSVTTQGSVGNST